LNKENIGLVTYCVLWAVGRDEITINMPALILSKVKLRGQN